MTDKELMSVYINFGEFLSHVFGSACEIVIHDLTDYEHSIVAIYNNASGREVGNPITNFAKQIISSEDYKTNNYQLNYNGKSKGKDFLSSTYYIKNDGKIIGLFCINKDLTLVNNANSILISLLDKYNIKQASIEKYSEDLNNPVSSMIHSKIDEIIGQAVATPDRMTPEEKKDLVQRLNNEGLLNLKGAIAEIAERLHVSIPTIYRYLK